MWKNQKLGDGGWSNREVPMDLKKTALKLKEFGKITGIKIFEKPKIKDDNLGFLFTAAGMYLSRAKGYYIIPSGYGYPDVFIIFTKIDKVNIPYSEIIKGNKNNQNKTKKKYAKLIEKSKKNIKKVVRNNSKKKNIRKIIK